MDAQARQVRVHDHPERAVPCRDQLALIRDVPDRECGRGHANDDTSSPSRLASSGDGAARAR